MTPSGMMQRYWWRRALVMRSLLGRDRPRRIDRLIDYFGESPKLSARETRGNAHAARERGAEDRRSIA